MKEQWVNCTTQQIDLAFNVFFLLYFFLRVSSFGLAVLWCCAPPRIVTGGAVAAVLSVAIR